jgi:hypothetical protein
MPGNIGPAQVVDQKDDDVWRLVHLGSERAGKHAQPHCHETQQTGEQFLHDAPEKETDRF